MSLTIELPQQLEDQLRSAFGSRLHEEAKHAMAIEMYRQQQISVGQVAQILGTGVLEAEEWLAKKGVEIPMTVEDLARELEGSKRLFSKK